MNAVKFEQMLSFRPSHDALCLRDFIFDYYCGKLQDTDRANRCTKNFTDSLFEKFGEAR